jgi:chromatin assembly factor 1 subunit A
MDPPRIPLNAMKSTSVNVNGSATKSITPFLISRPDALKNPTTHQQNPTKSKDSKPKKLIPAEDMEAFKQAVSGSDLSKVGLVEVLKKKFPGRAGAAIKGTLETVAKRVGVKEVDKRWVLVD